VVVALVVAACGGGEEEPTPAPTPTTPPPAATATPRPAPTVAPTPTPILPKRGGILRTRLIADPNPWNILRGPVTTTFPVFLPVLSSLVQFDLEKKQIVGDLAESFEFSGDGKQATFKIRRGVAWHDGRPLTAADIKFNLDSVFFATQGFRSHLQASLDAAAQVDLVDDATLRITLKRASNSFFASMVHAMNVVYPPHVAEAELSQGKVVGSNAFRWTDWRKGSKIELRSSPTFYGKGVDGRPLPYLDGIDWFMIGDTAPHLAALRTGQIDVFDKLNNTGLVGQVENIKKDIPGLIAGSTTGSWRMLLLKNKPPFSDIRVRKAIQLGLDRQEFVAAALGGLGVPAGMASSPANVGGLWGPLMSEQLRLPGINPSTKAQDIAEAVRLLREAGFTKDSPIRASVTVTAAGVFKEEAVVPVTQLNRLEGFRTELKPEESGVHNQRLVVPGGQFDIIYRPFTSAIDDPSGTIGTFWTTTASRNYGEWVDPQVQAWYDEQETTRDAARRRQLVRDIHDRLYDQAYNIVIAFAETPWVLRPDVKGLLGFGSYDNSGRFDIVWLDR